jgi:hypothetical protein
MFPLGVDIKTRRDKPRYEVVIGGRGRQYFVYRLP